MSLIKTSQLLVLAKKHHYAIGAFNVANMEMIMGAVQAAEELHSPIILQIAEGRLFYSPLHLIAPMLVEAAKKSKVQIAINFDHGKTINLMKQALDFGFSSVMVDYSHENLENNIFMTNEVKALADSYNASIEAEIGVVGGSEDDSTSLQVKYSNIDDIKYFLLHANTNALAVAIGNAHGHYAGEPHLNFDLLESISSLSNVPLVLHGGTGISKEDFHRCIQYGIAKINIATSSFDAIYSSIYSKQSNHQNFFEVSQAIVQATKENVMQHIEMFGSAGKSRGQ
ncbi:ketose-bisphosphate aldolase (plasmid) [Entomospira nematocerorum]|uniref:Ketose-bisphosphate aldolase n=1 Tax=Entomospira nematocerorum TaxID=2719987 RepID=A0A968GIG7_9SPIO|nr:ketose-bisphosphate aldolase [Entomospira nematocera]NIZ47721.1 ketose-bisphosphate aldolase [Entomospira nematocera]WDI34648.1 ketose-bisphosphate aldolase [Entomospira nematocera]